MVSFVFHWDQSNKFQMQETKKIKKKTEKIQQTANLFYTLNLLLINPCVSLKNDGKFSSK